MVLCEEFDDNTKSIKGIFNEITTNSSNRVSFCLVTFINSVGRIEENEFTLHFYIVERDADASGKRRGIYIGAADFFRDTFKKIESERSIERNDSGFSHIKIQNIPFISEGNYLIQAFKCNGRIGEETYTQLKQNSDVYRREGKLISVAELKIRFPK